MAYSDKPEYYIPTNKDYKIIGGTIEVGDWVIAPKEHIGIVIGLSKTRATIEQPNGHIAEDVPLGALTKITFCRVD